MNYRGIIASYFFSLLSKITNPEKTTQFKLVKDYSSNRVKELLSLGYKPTKTKNTDNAVLNKDNAINIDKVKINSVIWYVKIYTPSLSQQNILMNQMVRKNSTELQYPERSVFMKEVKTQKWWTFNTGNQEVINVPIWIFVFFQRNDRQHDESLINDTFCRMPITSAQFFIGNENYPDIGHLLNYDDNDDYAQGYDQVKEAFRALTKDDILQPYTSEDEFSSSNDSYNVGCQIYIFNIRYQKTFEKAQPIKVEFKFDGVIPAGLYGYSLVLTNKLISISSDGQRNSDLI